MKFAEPLVRGILVRRYKRFLADVAVPDGIVTVHCPNPGSMLGLDKPGFEAWLAPARTPERKLPFGLQMIRPGPEAALVGVNASLANALVEEALAAEAVPALAGYATRRREVRYGARSRVDFVLEAPGRPPCYVEVKSVTLRRDGAAAGAGLAEFPDAVTARGARHLSELAGMARAGARAVMLFVVQRGDCDRFALAADIDPAYAAAFAEARAAGVELAIHRCALDAEGIGLDGPLPYAG
jgi:sugar fermentation stimulation protein A